MSLLIDNNPFAILGDIEQRSLKMVVEFPCEEKQKITKAPELISSLVDLEVYFEENAATEKLTK